MGDTGRAYKASYTIKGETRTEVRTAPCGVRLPINGTIPLRTFLSWCLYKPVLDKRRRSFDELINCDYVAPDPGGPYLPGGPDFAQGKDFEVRAVRTAPPANRPPELKVPYDVLVVTVNEQTAIDLQPNVHFVDPDSDTLVFAFFYYDGANYTSVLPAWASYSGGILTVTAPAAMDYLFRIVATDPGSLTALENLTLRAIAPAQPTPKILNVTRQLTATDLVWVLSTQLVTGYPYRLEERHKPNQYQVPGDDFGQWLEIAHDAGNELRYTYANGKPQAGQSVRFEFRIVRVDTGGVVDSQPVLGFDYTIPAGIDGPTPVYP